MHAAFRARPQDMLTEKGVHWEEVSDLREVAADVDVLYQTRIQKERFTDMAQYAKVRPRERRRCHMQNMGECRC